MSEEHLRSHLQLGELSGPAGLGASAKEDRGTAARSSPHRPGPPAFRDRRCSCAGAVDRLRATGVVPGQRGAALDRGRDPDPGRRRRRDPRFPCRRPWLVRPDTGARPGRSLGAHGVGGRRDFGGRVGAGRAGLRQRSCGSSPRGPGHRLPARSSRAGWDARARRRQRHNLEPSSPRPASRGSTTRPGQHSP